MDYITSSSIDTFLGDEKARLLAAGISANRYASTVAEVNDEVAGYVGPRVLTHVPLAPLRG